MISDEREWSPSLVERFPLNEGDRSLIAKITNVMRRQLTRLPPKELKAASTALLALERLPYATPCVHVTVGFNVWMSAGNHAWADISFSDEGFRLSTGEHYYDPDVGGDTESRTLFATQSGTNWREGNLQAGVEEWLELADSGRFTVDHDETDYDAEEWYVEEDELELENWGDPSA